MDTICRRWTSRAWILALVGAVGCSSAGSAPHSPAIDGGPTESDGDTTQPDSGEAEADGPAGSAETDAGEIVSFAQDVMPIFKRSCSAGSAMCHGDPSVVTNGKGTGGNRAYLGPPYSAGDPTMILAGLVGQPSVEDPSMNVVTAGSPTSSYLMIKMDGTLAPLAAACASGGLGQCGASMPMGGQLLPQATRDTVRAWIAQGALNN